MDKTAKKVAIGLGLALSGQVVGATVGVLINNSPDTMLIGQATGGLAGLVAAAEIITHKGKDNKHGSYR